MKAPRCAHGTPGGCPRCRAFERIVVAKVPTMRKGHPSWTATFGRLSAESAGAGR